MKVRHIVILCLLVLLGFALWLFLPRQRAEVRNSSGRNVKNLVLEMSKDHGDWKLRKEVAELSAGQTIRIRHSQTDLTADLHFEIDGHKYDHKEEYIDLWTGEGWRFDIQPDGTVKSGSYDYPDVR